MKGIEQAKRSKSCAQDKNRSLMQKEKEELSTIDNVSLHEFLDGESTTNDIDYNGIELSIHGSDDEFAQEDNHTSQSLSQASADDSSKSSDMTQDNVA